ncbi:hypothetical protein L9F63_022141 [Diploptera punctata]|uniref:Amine oxidase domain-containing protein n=1 Tax=Diploptera punctata TaxID=6984 RepID=A0AAD7ZPH8_DIPPU|nr:hypothetical protein L9F63_022141 [Diploptera punctata]
MTCKILLVGTGITGAVIASRLRTKLQNDISLVVWDKAKGCGGRMSTSRSPLNLECQADLGAQYITLSQENFQQHKDLYESLLNEKLLEPLSCKIEGMKDMPKGTQHLVAPNGMNSLVKYFFNNVPDKTCFEHHVSMVSYRDRKWKVETESGVNELFDIVILTMPIPQIFHLTDTIKNCISNDIINNLASVKYSSRYALVLFFNSIYALETNWDAKYVYNDEVFRYISFDNRKRNRPDLPLAAVFHTSVQYGLDNIERDLSDIQNELVNRVNNMFPTWPKPVYIKCHRWRYSQVLSPYKGQPGFVTLAENPLLIAGGDGFKSSHINDCISSAVAVTDVIFETIKNSK